MRVVLFGATGMVGKGVLLECLDDPGVEAVLVIGRRTCGVAHAKVTEVLHGDFHDYTALQPRWPSNDACFFCLGVSSAGMDERKYHMLTYDLAVAAARSMVAVNPAMTFCYVSGVGTDGTGQSRMMWARVKGETENVLLGLGFKGAYMFRPGYIQPMKGVRSMAWYQPLYDALGWLYPVLRRLFPGSVTTTQAMGLAMIRVARTGDAVKVLEPRDINRVAERA